MLDNVVDIVFGPLATINMVLLHESLLCPSERPVAEHQLTLVDAAVQEINVRTSG